MLDVEGFVAETNATNMFLVRYNGVCGIIDHSFEEAVLVTPSADHCLPGITRDTVLLLAKEIGIKTEERRVSLSEFYSADEVFTTGTMGELTPVTKIDGRSIGWSTSMRRGRVTELLQEAYKDAVATRDDWSTEIPLFS
jgi:branched-subunit amino acid aminotransferase/4-amino-4-deoxychorismate lyase